MQKKARESRIRKALYVLAFVSVSSNVLGQKVGSCDIAVVRQTLENLNNLDQRKIQNFLLTFDKSCNNNIEYSEFSNEVLFKVLDRHPSLVVTLFEKEEKNLDTDKILSVLGDPVSDQIDINALIGKVEKTKASTVVKSKIIQRLKEAYQRYSPKAQIVQIATNINGNVGVYAMILETGESVSHNADKRFPMQSVYKFPISMAVLDRVDKGEFTLDQKIHVSKSDYIPSNGHSPLRDKFPDGVDISIRDLIRYNVAESDGTACDVLLRISGGTKNADGYVHSLGIKDMAIATTEMIQVANDTIQYQNWSTPKAMTDLLKIFYAGKRLSEKSRDVLLTDMIESSPGRKRLKGLLPEGTITAHKTGTAGTIDGLTRATNDAGIITLPNGKHLAISVFISDSHASLTDRELTIASISKACYDFWSTEK